MIKLVSQVLLDLFSAAEIRIEIDWDFFSIESVFRGPHFLNVTMAWDFLCNVNSSSVDLTSLSLSVKNMLSILRSILAPLKVEHMSLVGHSQIMKFRKTFSHHPNNGEWHRQQSINRKWKIGAVEYKAKVSV